MAYPSFAGCLRPVKPWQFVIIEPEKVDCGQARGVRQTARGCHGDNGPFFFKSTAYHAPCFHGITLPRLVCSLEILYLPRLCHTVKNAQQAGYKDNRDVYYGSGLGFPCFYESPYNKEGTYDNGGHHVPVSREYIPSYKYNVS